MNILTILVYLFSSPLILLQSIIFIFKQKGDLFKNNILCCYYMVSLGHSFVGIDLICRLSHPEKITLVYLPYPRTNEFLIQSFYKSANIIMFKPYVPKFLSNSKPFYMQTHFIMRTLLGFIVFWKSSPLSLNRKYILYFWNHTALTLFLRKSRCDVLTADYKNNKLIPRYRITGYNDFTGYTKLLELNAGIVPQLPEEIILKAEKSISTKHPEFKKEKLITLHLRKKGNPNNPDDYLRTVFDQKTYIKAVEYLSSGYFIAGIGEIEHEYFQNIKNYIDTSRLQGHPKMLNAYFLMNCKFFIGVQSGPHVMPNSCKIPALITNAFPLELGTFAGDNIDLIIFKRLYDKDGNLISLTDIYNSEIAFGLNFDKLKLQENSEDEILEGIKQLINQDMYINSNEYKELINKYRKLLKETMPIYYSNIKPTYHFLRNSKW